MKNLNRVISPINIVAIFAALSEASAATTLPYLDEESRQFYLWFLILFPCVLIVMFFFTINFNRAALAGATKHEGEDNTSNPLRVLPVGILSMPVDTGQLATLLDVNSTMAHQSRTLEILFVQRT